MAVCWRHSTILNSYSPQMEQREPEKRMLICLENAIYLLNVAPSNPLPHPLSPPPISLQFKDFIQQSRILHALYRKKMPPDVHLMSLAVIEGLGMRLSHMKVVPYISLIPRLISSFHMLE